MNDNRILIMLDTCPELVPYVSYEMVIGRYTQQYGSKQVFLFTQI